MTIDDAVAMAVRLLDERGQLLNGHLLRLVEGDKNLFREVRERLLVRKLAEDRSGVGLARIEKDRSDWWLMQSGVIRGPVELADLCDICLGGEIQPGDVVRSGESGLWQQPDDVPELAAIRSHAGELVASLRTMVRPFGESSVNEPSVPPEKSWSAGKQVRSGFFWRIWGPAADVVGGSKRLTVILLALMAIGAVTYWWRQPPSNDRIFQEFTTCRAALQRLRDRRVVRSEWAPVVERYRPRIESIVGRLRPRATDRHPVEKSLYLAGGDGLLRLLDNPIDPTDSDRVFETQMTVARESMKRLAGGR